MFLTCIVRGCVCFRGFDFSSDPSEFCSIYRQQDIYGDFIESFPGLVFEYARVGRVCVRAFIEVGVHAL
jgi:hypothetical protein